MTSEFVKRINSLSFDVQTKQQIKKLITDINAKNNKNMKGCKILGIKFFML